MDNKLNHNDWISLCSIMQNRREKLVELSEKAAKYIMASPQGRVRIAKKGKSLRFYLVSDETKETYIRKNNRNLAVALMQKEYYKELYEDCTKELKVLDEYLNCIPEDSVTKAWDKLNEYRKQFVIPATESDDDYTNRWINEPYEMKLIGEEVPDYYTDNGEHVRSKSEIIIANLLKKYNVPYKYEKNIYLERFGRVAPDFTCLNVRKRKEIKWEHLGMMDNPDYAENSIRKIAAYERNGYRVGENLLLTFESSMNPINVKDVEAKIKRYLL